MPYRIGAIARLLGMSSEGLRLYERAGILQAGRESEQNDYRTYTHLDITALIRARGYHYCGFSTKQIERLINAESVGSVVQDYIRRETELQEEIMYKRMLLHRLREMRKLCEQAEQSLWTIEVRSRPAMYRFAFMCDETLILTPEQEKVFRGWVEKTPFAFPSQSNDWAALLRGQSQVSAALGVWASDAHRLGLDYRYAERYPSCPCLYTLVKEQGEHTDAVRCLSHLAAYVRRQGLTVTGDPIARTFLSLNKKQDYTRYRQVWLPIAEPL